MGVLRFAAFLHVFLNMIWVLKCIEANAPADVRSEINDDIDKPDHARDLLVKKMEALKGIFF